MKVKYHLVGTDEEIEFGEDLCLTLTKESKEGTHTFESTVTFSPELVELLMEEGVIEPCKEKEEEEEVENNHSPLDFEDAPCDAVAHLMCEVEFLEKRLAALENFTNDICKEMMKLIEYAITSLTEEKPEVKKAEVKKSSKKK